MTTLKQLLLIALLATANYANNCSKWYPMPTGDGLVAVLNIYDERITAPDLDCDEIIDTLDTDIDGDGVSNNSEIANGTDPRKPDTDGDGVSDIDDIFPLNPAENADSDHDGTGDNADLDDDNDGYSDLEEIASGSNPTDATSQPKSLSMSIFHINDTHSHIDSERLSFEFNGTKTYYYTGGYPRIKTKLDVLRTQKPNSLMLNAGDIFQGTLYYSLFKGAADADAINLLDIDAYTLGNHSFDDGDNALKVFLDRLNTDISVLSANVVPSVGNVLENKWKPYVIKEVDGQKIGIIGITVSQKTQESSNPSDEIEFLDEMTTAQKYIDELTAMGINKIVLLTHQGYNVDRAMAQQLNGVDVIIGGDSHTYLGNFGPFVASEGAYPTIEESGDKHTVCIAQAGQYGKILGNLDILFDNHGHVNSCLGRPILLVGDTFLQKDANGTKVEVSDEVKAQILNVISMHDIEIVEEDNATLAVIKSYKDQVDIEKNKVIGSAGESLRHIRIPGQDYGGTSGADLPLGSEIAPIVAKSFYDLSNRADACIQNAGGVRVSVPEGNITMATAYELLPFANTLFEIEMKGSEIKQVLEDALSNYIDNNGSTGSFPYAYGLKYDVNTHATANQRISNLEIKDRTTGTWSNINENKMYVIVTNSYIANGKDGYTTFKTIQDERGKGTDTYLDYAMSFVRYVEAKTANGEEVMKLSSDEHCIKSFDSNSTEVDTDGDGVTDTRDAFPNDANETVDTDGDGIGNNADTDDDNDGYSDTEEIAAGSDPLNANSIPIHDNNYTKIHKIQGTGATSPKEDETVTIEAIVIGDYQEATQLKGFFVQEEDRDIDNDNQTSEGIFVYNPAKTIELSIGDKVKIIGKVSEKYGLTQIDNIESIEKVSSGEVLPTAAEISLPVASNSDFEKYEGMLIHFENRLYATDLYNLSTYGEVKLSSNNRLWNPTQIARPGAASDAIKNENNHNTVILDDASTTKYVNRVIYPGTGLSKTNVLRAGDSVTGLTGVMSYGYHNYRIMPIDTIEFVQENPRPTMPEIEGNLKIASINVLNYFRTLDNNGSNCGPNNGGCRGADSLDELERQTAKMKSALEAMNADIIGLMEIENDGGVTAAYIANLITTGNYDYVKNPEGEGTTLGTDVITVGYLYNTDTVELIGNAKTIADGAYESAFDGLNRKPLAQTFKHKATNEIFTIINNHFKSKGSLSDGCIVDARQGNCNNIRLKAATDLISWINDDSINWPDNNFVIIGDLNAYKKEDPIEYLREHGFEDAKGTENHYSYIYKGESGTLDYILVNQTMKNKLHGNAKTWHINADESWVFDYNNDTTDANYGKPKPTNYLSDLYEANAFRMSDHDPVIAGFDFIQETNNTQPTGGIFISEYIEGSSNNKAIELYNNTGTNIDLAHYKIEKYSNGSTTNPSNITLSGTLANHEAYVIAHTSATQEILDKADKITGALNFNGNDHLALVKISDNSVIDIVGIVGSSDYWGKDKTLRRQIDTTIGSTMYDASKWDELDKDTFDGLGRR